MVEPPNPWTYGAPDAPGIYWVVWVDWRGPRVEIAMLVPLGPPGHGALHLSVVGVTFGAYHYLRKDVLAWQRITPPAPPTPMPCLDDDEDGDCPACAGGSAEVCRTARSKGTCAGCANCLSGEQLAGLEEQPWWRAPAVPCGGGL